MKPLREYKIRLKITKIEKAKPNVHEPDPELIYLLDELAKNRLKGKA